MILGMKIKTVMGIIYCPLIASKLTHAEGLRAFFAMQQISIFQIITILRATLTF